MSLATVYKALKTLVEVNLVQELNVGEGNFRYDGNISNHAHIQCINCTRVDDIEGIHFENLNKEIEAHTEYDILSNQIYFYGMCKECKDQNSLENND